MKQLLIILLLSASYIPYAVSDVPDTMAERVKACTICHNDGNQADRNVYYPRISGKPYGYLFNQLKNFRDKRRYYQPMAILVENMTDDYLMDIARYFSELQLPYPPPEKISIRPNEVKLVEKLMDEGDASRDIPACRQCHGQSLMGISPSIPGLLGLPHIYLSAQLGAWRNGGLIRGQQADCMSKIAKRLTDLETIALSKWLATQPARGKPDPVGSLPLELAQRCDHITQNH